MKTNYYILFLIVLFSSTALGQTPTWKSFTAANTSTTLCNHNVLCINGDAQGNKWFGTIGGISVFNGSNWTNYDQSDGLKNAYITSIVFDDDGTKWVSNGEGVAKFDGAQWTSYDNMSTNWAFMGDDVCSIQIDSVGNKWIAGLWALEKYDGTNFTSYHPDSVLGTDDNCNTAFAIDSNGIKWVGTYSRRIFKFDGTTWTSFDNIPGWSGVWVNSIVVDGDNNKWFCTSGGVFKYDGTIWTKYTQSDGLAGNDVRSMAFDSIGNKWFTTWGDGISKLRDSVWTTFNTSNSGLKINYVSCVYIDKIGNKWFGTYDGVSIYNDTIWTTLQSNGLADNCVNDIAIDQVGNKWFATVNGFSKFNGSIWSNYNTDNGLIGDYNSGISIAIDSSGNKWFGTLYGVSKFDGTNWINYDTTNSGLADNSPYTMEVDHNGNVWFAYFQYYTNDIDVGVTKFDGTNWVNYNTSNSGLPNNKVTSVAFDQVGNAWFGTFGGGISKFNGTSWVTYNTSNSGLLSDSVRTINIDKDGIIWIGLGIGWGDIEKLIKFDGSNWSYIPVGRGVSSIKFDKIGNKWVSNGSGVINFEPTIWTYYYLWDKYHMDDGTYILSPGFFNLSAFWTSNSNDEITSISFDNEGNKWISTRRGVSVLSTKDTVEFTVTPTNYDVNRENGTVFYHIKSNVSWFATLDSTWYTFGPPGNSGENGNGGDGKLLVNYTWNNNYVSRIGKVYFHINGLGDQEVTLTQHPTLNANIGANPNPLNGGTIIGAGTYNFGTIATLSASRQKGYAFINWTENGVEVSKDSIFRFIVNDDRTFVANFIRDIGISEPDYELPIYIYPNPAKDAFTVKVYRLSNITIEVSFYDLSGFLLQKNKVDTNSSCQFDVSTLPAGCYVLQINTGNELYTRKLTVIR